MQRSTKTSIEPFRGQVVRPEVAHDVVSPAYDALSAAQRQQFRAAHPDSYLHVTRSAEDEPDGDQIDTATLVARGRAALDRLVDKDAFVRHGDPAFYIYRLRLDGHTQHGLVCEVPSSYYHSVAKPHEATRDDRAALLAEHFATVEAASSPIACAVRDVAGTLSAALVSACSGEPVLDITGEDGLEQTVWKVDDSTIADEIQANLHDEPLFIIDGHHRSAANKWLADNGTDVPVLATIFPDQSLQLVGFHRLLQLAPDVHAPAVIEALSRRFVTQKVEPLAKVDAGQVALVVEGIWYRVTFDERPVAGGPQILLGSLDPVVLEREVLLGIVAAAGDYSISYVPDVDPFSQILERAESQRAIPIFVPPVAIDDMMAVAEGGVIMPAKSTYFTPKVRSGVFLRRF